jgi:hypothetical protein
MKRINWSKFASRLVIMLAFSFIAGLLLTPFLNKDFGIFQSAKEFLEFIVLNLLSPDIFDVLLIFVEIALAVSLSFE